MSATKTISTRIYKRYLRSPFVFGGRTIPYREGVLLRIEEGGEIFYAEAAPLPGHSKESLSDCLRALPLLLRDLNSKPGPEVPASLRFLWEGTPRNARPSDTDQWSPVKLNALLPSLLNWKDSLWRSWPHGTTVKVKFRPGEGKLLGAFMGARPDFTIRLDSNGGFDENSIAEFIESLSGEQIAKLEYWEDPLPPDSLKRFSWESFCSIPLAIDEGAPAFYGKNGFAPAPFPRSTRVWVCKPMVFGGLGASLEAARWLWSEFGIKTVLSSALESEVGRMQILRFLSRWGNEPCFAETHGLAVGPLFESDGFPPALEFFGPSTWSASTDHWLQQSSWHELS